MKPLNKYIDHTLLRASATEKDITVLCEEAKEYDFYSVCVNPCNVRTAEENLAGSDVRIVSVAGFPLGASGTASKVCEAREACENGADEIDMVMNIGALKSGFDKKVASDISAVSAAVYDHDAVLKVIIETCLLSDEEIVKACRLAADAGADFIKTSTGFNGAGADAGKVALIKKTLEKTPGKNIRIKASGGIKDRMTAEEMIKAGADRIGTSSSIAIMKG